MFYGCTKYTPTHPSAPAPNTCLFMCQALEAFGCVTPKRDESYPSVKPGVPELVTWTTSLHSLERLLLIMCAGLINLFYLWKDIGMDIVQYFTTSYTWLSDCFDLFLIWWTLKSTPLPLFGSCPPVPERWKPNLWPTSCNDSDIHYFS